MITTHPIPANRAEFRLPVVTEPETGPLLSIIVPIRNAEIAPEAIYTTVREQAEWLDLDWEVVFIDHAKSGAMWIPIQRLIRKDPDHVRGFILSGSRDRSDALALGYREAHGDLVFSVELDQHDDPKDLIRFLEKIEWMSPRDPCSARPKDEASIHSCQNILPRGILRRSAMTAA